MGQAEGVEPANGLPTVAIVGDGPLDGKLFAAFIVVHEAADALHVRAPLLLEIGEELRLRVDRAGAVTDVRVRVESHRRDAAGIITELAIIEGS